MNALVLGEHRPVILSSKTIGAFVWLFLLNVTRSMLQHNAYKSNFRKGGLIFFHSLDLWFSMVGKV